MSVTIKFYTFAKRINSTKQPTGAAALSADCIIKRGSSIINPTIELDIGLATSPAAYNYAYIADWNRYYWVQDWVFNERLWTAKLVADPLASFKTSIGSYSGYVLRSASSYDGDIIDTLYPALAKITTSANNTNQSPNWDDDFGGGSYVVGIMGKDNGQNGGAVTYYSASPSAMRALCNYMLDTANLGSITDIEMDLLKCIFNPMQYIVSCMWFPFTPAYTNGNVYVGWWDVSGSGLHQLTSGMQWKLSMTYNIPKHPKAATRGAYLNAAPFSRYHLFAGAFGTIPIDSGYLLGQSTLNTYVKVDCVTGSGKLVIEDSSGNILEEHFAQVGVPIQVGQNLLNQGAVSGVTGGVMNTVSAALTGNPAGMLGAGMETIGSAAALSQSVPSTVGGNGSCTFMNQWKLIGKFLDIADEDLASRGRPLCKAKTISSLSGYIMCSDADPDIACTDYELAQIVSYMNGGFYYE